MAKVNLGIQLDVNTRNVQGWKLGTAAARVTDADTHKAVVLDKTLEGTLKLAVADAEIRGFIESIEPHSADGQTFGSVLRHAAGARYWVTGTGLVKGDLVVADAQAAVGVKNTKAFPALDLHGLTKVKKGTPTTYKWEVVRDRGDGVYLIEAI